MIKFGIEQTDERITSQAGLSLVAEFSESLRLKELVNKHLPKPGSANGYSPHHHVLSLVLMMIGGGEALDHVRKIASDNCLLQLLGLEKLPSPDATGDWLRRHPKAGLSGARNVLKDIIQPILVRDEREDFTLDADATGIESNKEAAKMTYKGFHGYMPMLANLVEIPFFIVDEFREGNVSPQARALEILEEAVAFMPKGKRIARLRSDSAWYQAGVFNYCEREKIMFSITADQDVAVAKQIEKITEWHPFYDRDGFKTEQEWGETVHTMNKTKEAFRLIVLRTEKACETPNQTRLFKEYRYHAIATNNKAPAQEAIHWHNGRGQSENYNKEIKLGFGLEHLPCGDFGANALYFRIGILAYNLIVAMKNLALGDAWKTTTIKTLRWVLLNTAGKLVQHGRRWILRLANLNQAAFDWWRDVRLRCQQLA